MSIVSSVAGAITIAGAIGSFFKARGRASRRQVAYDERERQRERAPQRAAAQLAAEAEIEKAILALLDKCERGHLKSWRNLRLCALMFLGLLALVAATPFLISHFVQQVDPEVSSQLSRWGWLAAGGALLLIIADFGVYRRVKWSAIRSVLEEEKLRSIESRDRTLPYVPDLRVSGAEVMYWMTRIP